MISKGWIESSQGHLEAWQRPQTGVDALSTRWWRGDVPGVTQRDSAHARDALQGTLGTTCDLSERAIRLASSQRWMSTRSHRQR